MKVRFSETFFSFQGEAELAGTPTVWLRFFGCNLECNGFGQKHPTKPETWKLPYKSYDLIDVKRVEDLPVWEYGCDSSYTWSNKYKHLAQDMSVEEVCDRLLEYLPYNKFRHVTSRQEYMLAFTGGEPMLQQRQMKAILNEYVIRGNFPKLVTIETNGTKKLRTDFKDFINHFLSEMGVRVHFAISPKTWHTAGEKDAFDVPNFMSYLDGVNATGIVKIVCNGTKESWREIHDYAQEIRTYAKNADMTAPDIWIMPAGATKEEQENVAEICNHAMQCGYKVATRNHCYVYGNQIGT